jgi:FKBP12-rapamycin complex-associated protein
MHEPLINCRCPRLTLCTYLPRLLRSFFLQAMLEAFVHDPLINWRLLNTTEAATEAALARESQEAAAAAAAAGGGAPGAAGGVAVGAAAAAVGGPGAVLTSGPGPQVCLGFRLLKLPIKQLSCP